MWSRTTPLSWNTQYAPYINSALISVSFSNANIQILFLKTKFILHFFCGTSMSRTSLTGFSVQRIHHVCQSSFFLLKNNIDYKIQICNFFIPNEERYSLRYIYVSISSRNRTYNLKNMSLSFYH